MANILIVEDEIVEAMNLKNSLQSMGYDVLDIVSSGNEAIEKANKLKPDLILMDIFLKGDIDGIEAAKSIKQSKIPIIYLTAFLDDNTVNRALLSEPYGYIIKPYDHNKLKISIEVALYKDKIQKRLNETQENYYETIFENTGTSTVIIEEDKTLSLVNTEFSNLTGYSKDEIENKMKWPEFFVKEDVPFMKEFHDLRRINPVKAPRNYETRLITRNNNVRNVLMTVAMIPKTKKSMASIVDMTELQQSKKAIEKSREKFKTIFENAAEAIVLFDRHGTILEANDKIENISGFRKKELIGQNFMKLLPQVQIEHKKALISFKELITGNELEKVQWTLTNRDGKQVFFLARPSVIKNKNRIEGLVLIMEDITERKIAEDGLKDSLKQKELLLREIHHRVKNNLQIISSLLSLQRIQVPDSETADILAECQGRVRTMAMIHENLYQSKDISQIEFDNYLHKLLSDIMNSYKANHSIILNMNVGKVEMGIETAMPCGLIINELATNSIKHAFPNRNDGNIKVELKHNDDSYVLIYSDDGVGLPKNINPRDSKKLGLMVVETLVNQLNGLMEIDRTDGTKFTIKFNELPYEERMKL